MKNKIIESIPAKVFAEQRISVLQLIKNTTKWLVLVHSNIIITDLNKKFNPKQYFTKNKKVKYWLTNEFQEHVLSPIETMRNIPGFSLFGYQFTEFTSDKEIMDHFQISESNKLMNREQIIWLIVKLTSKQPEGEDGILQNNVNTMTVVGYIQDNYGLVRAVVVYWNLKTYEWRCACFEVVKDKCIAGFSGSGPCSRILCIRQ